MRNSNRTIWTSLFVATAFVFGFTSCEQKDTNNWMSELIYSSAQDQHAPTVDDDPQGGGGSGGSTVSTNQLLITSIPTQGWSGNSYNGVLYYVPETESQYYPRYYAFVMSNGVCQKAIFANYCYTASAAQTLYRSAYEGTYTTFDFNPSSYKSGSILSSETALTDIALPFTTVKYESTHVYVDLDYLFKGKYAVQVENVVNYWSIGKTEEGGYDPDQFIFGTFSLDSHQLDLSTVRGLPGCTLQTKYNLYSSGTVSTYVRYLSFNNRDWARYYFDMFYSWNSSSAKLNAFNVTYYLSASGYSSSWAYGQAQYDDWWYSFHSFAGWRFYNRSNRSAEESGIVAVRSNDYAAQPRP